MSMQFLPHVMTCVSPTNKIMALHPKSLYNIMFTLFIYFITPATSQSLIILSSINFVVFHNYVKRLHASCLVSCFSLTALLTNYSCYSRLTYVTLSGYTY